MPLQDLTPQLRTRLNRMERAVGWFVFLATVLLLFGFGYYIYHTAERKGWFMVKAPFFTFVKSSSGLNVGDPVYLMGSPVGQITALKPCRRVTPIMCGLNSRFRTIMRSLISAIWTAGSVVKLNAGDFLGKRRSKSRAARTALPFTYPASFKPLYGG